jgi:CBS domain-containing protein
VLARELARPFPTVRKETAARVAAEMLAEHRLPGLIVVDDNDHPVAILPASQVLRVVVPRYVQDDPALARVLDEAYGDTMCEALDEKTVADMLPRERVTLPVVAPDDTVVEIAAIMAANRSPVVAVAEERSPTSPTMGAITASALLEWLLADRPRG